MPSEGDPEVRRRARELAERRLAPQLAEWDQPAALPVRELVTELGELGLLGLGVPAAEGGSGGSRLDLCVAIEEIYRQCPALAASAYIGVLAAADLRAAGGEKLARLVSSILAGESIAALAITEQGAGSDVAAIETTAVRSAGGWTLSGSKRWVLNAPIADLVLVLARTTSEDRPRFGLFAVPAGTPGMTASAAPETVSWRGASVGELAFDRCELADDAVVGDPGDGLRLVFAGFDLERITLACGAVGLASAALDSMRERSGERIQFGGPIGSHQSIRFLIARAAAEVEAARRLAYAAAAELDRGGDATALASMAKLVASETAQRVTRDAVHLHGAEGLAADAAVARRQRDSLIMTIGGGTSEMQLEIIARELGLPAVGRGRG